MPYPSACTVFQKKIKKNIKNSIDIIDDWVYTYNQQEGNSPVNKVDQLSSRYLTSG